MMTISEFLLKISTLIRDQISSGLIFDEETLRFINSSYGISQPDEITSFIHSGEDIDAVIDMLSYPSESFRESIEELIPAGGISVDKIKNIENTFSKLQSEIFVLFNNEKIFLSKEYTFFCYKRFLQRLNLQVSFEYLDFPESSGESFNFFKLRALLRKKKFISNSENSLFINDLIHYYNLKNNSNIELTDLLDISTNLLSNSMEKPFEIFSQKKYFYENAIMEYEEFNKLLKTYSMEFIMLKRIQPPLISIEEARTMVKAIDRLTSIVYGMVIPSVRNILIDEF